MRASSAAARRPPASGVVKEVRMARRPSGELRIVLDLTRPMRAEELSRDAERSLRLPTGRGPGWPRRCRGCHRGRRRTDQGRACAPRGPRPHHRHRRRARRRGSGRHRQERHAREGRDARHRARARRSRRCRARHARGADPRRRLLRPAARSHAARPRAASGSVRVHPRRFDPRSRGRRLLGVHLVPARRHQRGGALARGARERRRI